MHESRRRPLRPPIVIAAVAAFTATGAMTTTACSRYHRDRYVNCVNEQGQIVDPRYCDDDGYRGGGHYYYYPSSRRYSVGYRLPSSWRSSRIDPTDSGARSRAGLPGSGRIGGTSVRSGGFGGGHGTSGHGTSGHGTSGHGGGS